MSFDHGSMSLAIFDLPEEVPDNVLDLFAAAKAGSLDSVGIEPQIGWVAGRHLLDTDFSGEGVAPGGCYYLALRQAVRKLPAALLNALCKREEYAKLAAENREFLKSKEKKEIREEVIEKYTQKMPPSLSGIQLVIDPSRQRLYVGATSRTQLDYFIDNFYQVMKQEPVQICPEYWMEKHFHSTCASLPVLATGDAAPGDPQTGRDFLMFLWYYSEKAGKIEVPDRGEFDLMIEGPLVFAGEGGERGAGEATVKKGDSPVRSAEAKAAIAVGKKLRKATLTITHLDQIWSGTFDADQFTFSSFKVPESEEVNDFERFADRIAFLDDFTLALEGYFKLFVESIQGGKSSETAQKIRDWAHDRDAI
ncbi:MAG: recombination-associated protein RdgC [Victivallaceae bacterium]|nr:recombination-associated protein RdgC [Victivallaceae bacterium]